MLAGGLNENELSKEKMKEKWIYNTYYPTIGKIGRFFQMSPALVALFYVILFIVRSYITNEPAPILFLGTISVICVSIAVFLYIINIRGVIQDAAPIKVKITDEALYFMKSSGKIIKIKLEDIEVVKLRKTIFDGYIVGIMERKDENTVKYCKFYLSKRLGEAIIKKHSKYVDYGLDENTNH